MEAVELENDGAGVRIDEHENEDGNGNARADRSGNRHLARSLRAE